MEFQFTDPAQAFRDGLEVIRDYHDALLRQGGRLVALADEIHAGGMTEARAHRCIELHGWFTRADRLHHQDEEYALFPVIVNGSFLIDGMIERLTLDHEEIEAAWVRVAGILQAPEAALSASALQRNAHEFEDLQRRHLTRENEDFLSLVERLLDARRRSDIAAVMLRMRTIPSSVREKPTTESCPRTRAR